MHVVDIHLVISIVYMFKDYKMSFKIIILHVLLFVSICVKKNFFMRFWLFQMFHRHYVAMLGWHIWTMTPKRGAVNQELKLLTKYHLLFFRSKVEHIKRWNIKYLFPCVLKIPTFSFVYKFQSYITSDTRTRETKIILKKYA